MVFTDVIVTVYSLITAFGVLNVAVIFAVLKGRQKSATNVYVMHLSIADLIYTVTVPFLIVNLSIKTWIFGDTMCKAFLVLESTNKYASVGFLLLLSFDRYLAICHPTTLSHLRTPRFAMAVSVVCWAFVSVLMFPQYIYSRAVWIPQINRTICGLFWPGNATDSSPKAPVERQFIIGTFTLVFLVPIVLICGFYAKALRRLRQVTRAKSRQIRRSDKNYKRVTRTILAVIVCHIVCWLPYWILTLITSVVRLQMSRKLGRIFTVILMLPYVNSSLNPILYGLLNRNYRETLCSCGRSNRKSSDRTTGHAGENLLQPQGYRKKSSAVTESPTPDCTGTIPTRLTCS